MKSGPSIGKFFQGALLALVLSVVLSGTARAACNTTYPVGNTSDGVVSFLSAGTNPPFVGPTTTQAVEAGSLVYNSADNTLQLCDGTSWKVLNAGPAGTAVGQIQYNNATLFGADSKLVYVPANSQLVVGATTPAGSAALDVTSTNRGFLPPRMTTAQRNAIASPVEGLVLYNTTDKQMQYFDGAIWRPFGASVSAGNGSASGAAGLSCKQILNDYGLASGTYWIDPDLSGPVAPFQVYCDMVTDGGGWMLVARNNATTTFTNFNKTWAQYKVGFGDVTTNTSLGWIGNDNLYYLTIGGKELAVRDNVQSHYYASFNVANEANKYRLTVAQTASSNDSNATFAGTHNGMNFTTTDQDNDTYSSNCATTYAAGWWYGSCYVSSIAGNASSPTYWRSNSGMEPVTWIEMWIR